MALDLKANTAVDVLIGPFVDDTDGKTAETGLTVAQADVRLSKNGQNMAQKNDATSCVHDELGYYNCELDATDTNTEGSLVLCVHESGALPVRHEFNIMAEAAWDSLYAAKDTGYMDVNVKAVSEDTTAADNLESACDNYSATRGLSGTALPAVAAGGAGGIPTDSTGKTSFNDLSAAEVNTQVDTALSDIHLDHLLAVDYDPASKPGVATALLNELVESDAGVSRFTENSLEQAPSGTGASAATIADAVWDEAQADHVAAGSFGLIASEIADILVDTNSLDGTKIPDTISLAAINAEVDTAIETYHLDHLLAVDYDPATKPGVATALLNELIESDVGVSRFTANALEEAPTGGSAPTVGEIADAVWDEDIVAAHNTADTAGALLDDLGTPGDFKADVSGLATTTELNKVPKSDGTTSWNATALAAINAEADTALSDYDPPTKAELDSGLAGLNDPTAATIADAVWDEAQAGHVAVGSFGVIASEIADILVDTNELQTNQGNWVTATGFATEAKQDIIDANVDAILVDTGTTLDGKLNTAQADLDILTGADGATLATAQANYAPATAADVNAQVLDVLNVDTFAEPGDEAPTATTTLVDKIGYLYKFLRNKIESTSSKIHVYDDAGTNKDHTAATSDDGTTFTRGEFVAGDP